MINDYDNGIFSVKGTSGKDHNNLIGLVSCSCFDWIMWHLPYIFTHYSNDFASIVSLIMKIHLSMNLPEIYFNGAYLSIDDSAITNFFKPPAEDTLPTESVRVRSSGHTSQATRKLRLRMLDIWV